MTTEECFEAAVQVENLMRDVYARLADRFAAEAKLKEMFLRLAEEEEQHAHRIRLLARTQLGGAWADATAARISRDLGAMSAALLQIVEDLEAEWDGESARKVLRRIIDAENLCASIHAEELASSAEIDVQMLFWSLSKQDVRHKELLQRAMASA